jgi:uncharacterized repeat protein (TIGR03803 family)
VILGDVLFGSTIGGGAGAAGPYGTLFRIKNDGSDFQTIHHFDLYDADNGGYPAADLVRHGDHLFGMTRVGGTDTGFGLGTLFKCDTTGTNFEVIHRFLGPDYNAQGDDDGSEPYGALTVYGSHLYGMTTNGGANGWLQGTIFRIKPDGTDYRVLHNFAGGTTDGRSPYHARPVCKAGMLYTTTRFGGSVNDYGTVVSMEIEEPVAVPDLPEPVEAQRLMVGSPLPNPVVTGASLIVPITLPVADVVVLRAYTVAGRLLATREARFSTPGRHEIRWALPEAKAAGTYYLRARTGAGLEAGTHWTVIR